MKSAPLIHVQTFDAIVPDDDALVRRPRRDAELIFQEASIGPGVQVDSLPKPRVNDLSEGGYACAPSGRVITLVIVCPGRRRLEAVRRRYLSAGETHPDGLVYRLPIFAVQAGRQQKRPGIREKDIEAFASKHEVNGLIPLPVVCLEKGRLQGDAVRFSSGACAGHCFAGIRRKGPVNAER